MISILIPTYNYDSSALIKSLARQGKEVQETQSEFCFEIIVADDASTQNDAAEACQKATEEVGGRYISLTENIGRAHIRNRLAREAKYPYLLFIDCDAAVSNVNALADYWAHRDDADVVCGTILTPQGPPERGHELRFRYEHDAKSRSVEARRRAPYIRVFTFSIMFHARVFSQIQFDERCVDYGFEDTLMGLSLRDRGFTIAHIDAPLVHMGIDTNEVFLKKTETALHTLLRLDEPSLHQTVGPSRICQKLQKLGLLRITAWLFGTLKAGFVTNLCSRRPSLLLFQLYKVGFYATISLQAKRQQ